MTNNTTHVLMTNRKSAPEVRHAAPEAEGIDA